MGPPTTFSILPYSADMGAIPLRRAQNSRPRGVETVPDEGVQAAGSSGRATCSLSS